MKIKVKIQITDSDGVTHECNIAEFDKGFECAAEIGLSIEDRKGLLLNLQQEIVATQARAFCEAHSTCLCCRRKLRSKGSKRIQYVRSREKGQSHFEVTVGKSIPADGPDRYLGLVQSHDKKPRRRLHEVLKDQGWQENQQITFMTDGGDTVINMARDMAPASEHILDWFHITMRITVMHQYVKGLAHHNPTEAEQLARILRQIKAYLWNGNLHDGQIAIDDLVMDLDEVETGYASIKALRKTAAEFQTYITNSAWMIPNYAERRRYGERVSTGFVESTVNTVVGKRFCKRQQMRWSKNGAHLMLQTRTRTLDGTLRGKFEQWYPGMKQSGEDKMAA